MGYTLANIFNFGKAVLTSFNLEPVSVLGACFHHKKQFSFSTKAKKSLHSHSHNAWWCRIWPLMT